MGLTPALARSGCGQALVENRELAPKALELERGDRTGRKQPIELIVGTKLTHAYRTIDELAPARDPCDAIVEGHGAGIQIQLRSEATVETELLSAEECPPLARAQI